MLPVPPVVTCTWTCRKLVRRTYGVRATLLEPTRAHVGGLVRSVRDLPEKSGIYHFLINFSSGMGEWYMKVVFEVLILFSLLSLISFT